MAANIIEGPAPSSSVFTLASGIGDELKRLLDVERLIAGRGPGDLLWGGESPSLVVVIEGMPWFGAVSCGIGDFDRMGGRVEGLKPELSSLRVRFGCCGGPEVALRRS